MQNATPFLRYEERRLRDKHLKSVDIIRKRGGNPASPSRLQLRKRGILRFFSKPIKRKRR
jgi:hypothetical protein